MGKGEKKRKMGVHNLKKSRVDMMNDVVYFRELEGLAEAVVQKENELGEDLGDQLRFSKLLYSINSDENLVLGKINTWYFMGNIRKKKYEVFEDKTSALMFIQKEFDKANKEIKDGQPLDPSWKGYWAREIERLA